MSKQTGWAAYHFGGTECFDIGAGWETKEEAIAELTAEGADMSAIEVRPAVSHDDWTTWEYV